MKKAYSYQRFSMAKQSAGDSTRRQTEAAEAFCRDHKLSLVMTFKDNGISGFRGKNFSNESALTEFIKGVERGDIEKNSVLVVENMDRLSRQSILPCLSKFIEIIGKGVSIGVISQGKILDTKSITENPMELMLVLVEFARANNESETKSKRTKSVLAKKIEAIQKGEKVFFSVQKPTWIIGLEGQTFIMDNKKVMIVKDIFARYLKGQSCSSIANDLNAAKVPTLGATRKGNVPMWMNNVISNLLSNKNCIGWFRINGVEVDNYFPPIISDKDFQLVQQRLSFNVSNRGGSKYGLVRNLFKGILVCAECGKLVEVKTSVVINAKKETVYYADYICHGVANKSGCKNKGRLNVKKFETRIIQSVVNPNEFVKEPIANNALNDLENRAAKVGMSISRYASMIETEGLLDMKELTANLSRLNKERAELNKAIEDEKGKNATVSNMPKVLKLICDEFKKFAKAGTNGDLELSVSKERLEKEVTDVQDYLKDTETRKELRNQMPNLFSSIRLTFGDMPAASYETVNGFSGWVNINVETGHEEPKKDVKAKVAAYLAKQAAPLIGG
jgi:DNA invertase Pin-like site-specific DNA recombinase